MRMAADTAHRFWLGAVNVTHRARPRGDHRGGAGGEGPAAGPALEGRLPALQAAAHRSGPRGPGDGLVSSGGDREAWLAAVREVADDRGLRYEEVGGINARDAPAALCPGGSNRLTGRARAGLLGSELRRRRARGGRLLLEGAAAAGGPRQGPHARPDQRRCPHSTSSRSRRRPTSSSARAARRRVQFESIEFNRRFIATVPRGPRPDRPARALQPGLPRLDDDDRPRGRLRRLRPADVLPLAAAGADPRGARAALDNAGKLFRRVRSELEEHGRAPTRPGPGTRAGALPGRASGFVVARLAGEDDLEGVLRADHLRRQRHDGPARRPSRAPRRRRRSGAAPRGA